MGWLFQTDRHTHYSFVGHSQAFLDSLGTEHCPGSLEAALFHVPAAWKEHLIPPFPAPVGLF